MVIVVEAVTAIERTDGGKFRAVVNRWATRTSTPVASAR
jgi:hypothetical protein